MRGVGTDTEAGIDFDVDTATEADADTRAMRSRQRQEAQRHRSRRRRADFQIDRQPCRSRGVDKPRARQPESREAQGRQAHARDDADMRDGVLSAERNRYSAALRDDPLKRELVQLTLPHSAKAKTRLCRDNLDPAVWSKLDSTPYGRYSSPSTRSLADSLNRLPAYRVPSSAKIHGAIDHYAIHQGNISHEFPRTKRTFPQRTNFGFAP
eukprot:6212973-Pleurochrysis_carterae.AAC.3